MRKQMKNQALLALCEHSEISDCCWDLLDPTVSKLVCGIYEAMIPLGPKRADMNIQGRFPPALGRILQKDQGFGVCF